MLIVPFAVGTVRGIADHEFRFTTVWLFGLWMIGYLSYFAMGLWLKSRRRAKYRSPMLVYGAIAAVCGVLVLLSDSRLLVWAPLFLPLLAIGLWASARRTERTILAGGVMVGAASLMTLVAYCACLPNGAIFRWTPGTPIIAIAVLLFAYFFGTVLYVKSMIRARGVRSYLIGSVAYHVVVAAFAIPLAVLGDPTWWWAVLFLAAMAVRAWLVPTRAGKVTPKALGIGEVVSTLAVTVVALVVG